jgi:hypothetical protein
MNFTPIEEAYRIEHVKANTYGGSIKYSKNCIYCCCDNTISLLNDGGSFRKCYNCKKNFRANIISSPIINYNQSISHIKPNPS